MALISEQNKVHLYKIWLCGLDPLDKPEFIQLFDGTKKQLKAKLLELSNGYCNDGEKSTLQEWETRKGNQIIEAVNPSDYSYIAFQTKRKTIL